MPAAPAFADPLTDADYRDLNKAAYLLNQLLPQIDKAKAAGRDVSEYELRRDDLAQQVDLLKRTYFPSKK